ncbi:MAG: hypothetical protein MZV64_04910 [Ignavibacteriales bacterium]|nr:hypothetical protein [Ignavibacteriales bacterium]
MSAVMQFLQTTFGPLVFVFTVSNLAAMGLQVRMPEVARGAAEQEVPGADLRVGLGGGAGVRLSDHPGPSAGGAIRRRGAPRAAWRPARRSCQQMVGKPAETWASPEPSSRWWRSARWC